MWISWPTRRESGLNSGCQADPWFLLCCNALQVLCRDEDTLGAPEQFCRYFSVWRRRGNAFLCDVETYPIASISTGATTRCWPRLIVPGTVSFLTWQGSHIHPTMQKFLVAGYRWSLTLPRETALSSPLGRSPQWRGACAQTLLLTGAPDCPAESATGSHQCNSLQCSPVHGSGRLRPTPLKE